MVVRLNIESGNTQQKPHLQCKESWSSAPAQPLTTIDDLIEVADFLVRNEQSALEITGTALFSHPDFEFFVRYLHNRGIEIVTNVDIYLQAADLDRLDHLAVLDKIRFKIDVGHLDVLSEADFTAWQHSVARIARRASIRLSLPSPKISSERLLMIFGKLPLQRHLDVAIRQWNPSEPQEFLSQVDLLDVGADVLRISEELAAVRVRVMMDCGTPACAFTEQQLGRLVQLSAGLGFWCKPLVEFRSGGTIIPCPSLPQHSTESRAGFGLDMIRAAFRDKGRSGARSDRKGIYDACNTCALRLSGRCAGGCRGYWSEPEFDTGDSA